MIRNKGDTTRRRSARTTRNRVVLAALSATAAAMLALTARTAAVAGNPDVLLTPDATGMLGTFTATGSIDRSNPFFQSIGSNGRACSTCHDPNDGWSITPANVQARFSATGGTDPIFRTVDGSVSPKADVSTLAARRRAYNMLLTKGLIRVGIGIPANAEFSLVAVSDPYGYASAKELSLFRRPLPSTNLPFLSAVMWDGRETVRPITGTTQAIQQDLTSQARDATLGHAQAATPPTPRQLQQIVSFEMGLYTAQVTDNAAGDLQAHGALGGPDTLRLQPFNIGINDPLGLNPFGTPFDPRAFRLFSAWANWPVAPGDTAAAARASIQRGQEIFDTRPIKITGVGGLNDVLHKPVVVGTCSTCHDSPNVGNHSVSAPLNIGVSDPSRAGLDTQGLPVYTLYCFKTGAFVRTTDPGRALITGKCADIGKFKGPILRGLAARPPYFHNGSAATLDDVVNFYNHRFNLKLTAQEKDDLAAFLRSL